MKAEDMPGGHSIPVTNRQKWTFLKVVCYFLYLAVGKRLPDGLGPIGRISMRIRRIISRPLLKGAADVFGIYSGVDFGNGSCLVMKEHANIGKNSTLQGNGTITIGKHVIMGHSCFILTQNHKYLNPEGYDGCVVKDVLIDDHAWLGHCVIILPGVRVGKHAIIGAGAVVSRSVSDYAIAVGNPAKVVKFRNAR